ncbi:MAG: hypothetical protein ACOC42_01250 [Halobacteriota archaeon]
MPTIDDDTTVTLRPSDLTDRELDVLSTVLEVQVENGSGRIESCTIDLERFVRAMTLDDSLNRFRYDWRWRHHRSNGPEGSPTD